MTGSTPSTQTTDRNTAQAAKQQQPNEAATRLPMRTSNDATTTEGNKPTTRQTGTVTPITTPPANVESKTHAGTNTRNAKRDDFEINTRQATRRRNTSEFYEHVPCDRRRPNGSNPRWCPARQQRVTEAPHRRRRYNDATQTNMTASCVRIQRHNVTKNMCVE